jgi:hypothetical protein
VFSSWFCLQAVCSVSDSTSQIICERDESKETKNELPPFCASRVLLLR